jgi:hypothetical protein
MVAYRELELLVAKIQKQLAPKAEVLHNVKMQGRRSNTRRQIDVLMREKIGQYDISVIIDCKDHKYPIDVKGVEEFYGLFQDVGAQKGVLVCPKGFTAAAKARAEDYQLELYSPVDTDAHKWRVKVTIPTICDFRSAAISFQFSTSAPLPFRLRDNFWSSEIIYDAKGSALGTFEDNAIQRWNNAELPTSVGEHQNLHIFETQTFMDNGYEPPLKSRMPVELTVSTIVQRQLYWGLLPVPHISGFLDQLSGKVITNAFTVGILDPDEVEKTWTKIETENEAPVTPVNSLTGLVGWTE